MTRKIVGTKALGQNFDDESLKKAFEDYNESVKRELSLIHI